MSAALLEVSHVGKIFTRGGLFSSRRIVAVDDVSFQIDAARPEIFTVIGESGSGKTTLSRMILNIERPTSGALSVDGLDLTTVRTNAGRMAFMHKVQPIFQNPFEAFNPLKQLDRYLFMTRRRFHAEADQATLEDAADRVPHAAEELFAQVAEGRNTHLGSFLHKTCGGYMTLNRKIPHPPITPIRRRTLFVGFLKGNLAARAHVIAIAQR